MLCHPRHAAAQQPLLYQAVAGTSHLPDDPTPRGRVEQEGLVQALRVVYRQQGSPHLQVPAHVVDRAAGCQYTLALWRSGGRARLGRVGRLGTRRAAHPRTHHLNAWLPTSRMVRPSRSMIFTAAHEGSTRGPGQGSAERSSEPARRCEAGPHTAGQGERRSEAAAAAAAAGGSRAAAPPLMPLTCLALRQGAGVQHLEGILHAEELVAQQLLVAHA